MPLRFSTLIWLFTALTAICNSTCGDAWPQEKKIDEIVRPLVDAEDGGIQVLETHDNDAIDIPNFREWSPSFSRICIGTCDPQQGSELPDQLAH